MDIIKARLKDTGETIEGFLDGKGHFDVPIDHSEFQRYNVEDLIIEMKETLGAHLRNLLTPYKNLLQLAEDVNSGKIGVESLRRFKCDNMQELIDFSKSEIMESTFWNKEKSNE